MDNKRKEKTWLSLEGMVNKTPPKAVDLEKAVIGIILNEKNVFLQASAILRYDHFYLDKHQRIFRAMTEMDKRGGHIDILTVSEEIIKNREVDLIGGLYYLTECSNDVVSSAHIDQHCLIILDKFMLREIAIFGNELCARALAGDEHFSVLNHFISAEQDRLWSNVSGFNNQSYAQLVYKRLSQIMSNDGSKPLGLQTMFPSLDRILQGVIPQLYIIAARPSMGKTALMVQLMENFSKQAPGGIIELESSDAAYIDRHLANKSMVSASLLKKGGLTAEHVSLVTAAAEEMINQPIQCLFDPDQDIDMLINIIRQWVVKFNIKWLLLDYAQLIKNAAEHERLTREQQVAKVVYALARISVKLNLAVFALAQLSREVTKRAGNRPILSDLRESGALEAAARCVIFIHRPEYYGELEDENGYSLIGITELIVAKNNEGDIGTCRLRLEKHLSRFTDMAFDPNSLGINYSDGYRPLDFDAF